MGFCTNKKNESTIGILFYILPQFPFYQHRLTLVINLYIYNSVRSGYWLNTILFTHLLQALFIYNYLK